MLETDDACVQVVGLWSMAGFISDLGYITHYIPCQRAGYMLTCFDIYM